MALSSAAVDSISDLPMRSFKIQFVDLLRQYQNPRPEIDPAILPAVGRGDFILGENRCQFEKEFAAFNSWRLKQPADRWSPAFFQVKPSARWRPGAATPLSMLNQIPQLS